MKIHSSALRPDSRRWLALIVVCFGQLMIVLDSTIVNVALPSIQRDLHFSQADLTWVVNAYLITYGSLLLLAGRAGDLIGRKRVFLAGVVVFTIASVLNGFAPTPRRWWSPASFRAPVVRSRRGSSSPSSSPASPSRSSALRR